jgi:hypothetical protein
MAKDQFKSKKEWEDYALATIGTRSIDFKAPVVSIGEVLEEIAPRGENTKLADVVDHEITIWDVQPFNSKYGPAAYILFTTEAGELRNAVTGGKVLLPKLLVCMERLPIKGTLTYTPTTDETGYYDLI